MSHFTIPVRDYMSAPVHTAAPQDTLQDAQSLLMRLSVSSLAVVGSAGDLLGVISRTDLLKIGRRQAGSRHRASVLSLPNQQIEEVMTKAVETIEPTGTVAEAAQRMVDSRIHRIFVTDKGILQGVLSPRDIMSAIADVKLNKPLNEFMSNKLFTIRHNEPLSLAVERLEKAHVTGLVVVDKDWPVGIFDQQEALEWKDEPRQTAVEEVMNCALVCLEHDTPLHRAAAHAASMDVRRVIAMEQGKPRGILTGLNFARAAC